MEKEYFLVAFRFATRSVFCLWFTGDQDGFVQEGGKILSADSASPLWAYGRANHIVLHWQVSRYDVAALQDWVSSDSTAIDCQTLLSFWNVFADITATATLDYYGNRDETSDVYSKLFYGNNLPTINMSGRPYIPTWMDEEVDLIKAVMKDGISTLEEIFKV